MYLLSNLHRRPSRTNRMTCAIDCLSAAALRRTTLWLSAGLAVLVLAAAASLTLSAPPPAAPQAGPPAPQASQAGPSAPQTSQGGPSRPEPLQTPATSETTPPAQAPPSAPPAIAGGAGVEFRLANADLLQFINLVAGELKLNYVVDPAVKGSVTINTAGKLNPGDLLPILETVLEINGATAVPSGNFYRIVPMKEAPKIPASGPARHQRERFAPRRPHGDGDRSFEVCPSSGHEQDAVALSFRRRRHDRS